MNEVTSELYGQMVHALAKPSQDILGTLDPPKVHLLHMIMGICGEAGELLDAIKKHVAYNKPLDLYNVVEELGDIEFYLEGFRQGLSIQREEVLIENINKLSIRYNNLTYSDTAAQTRADKA